jgi:hypothetical protein
MSQNIYKILFVLLIISLWSASLEFSFLSSLLVVLVGFKSKISKETFSFITILFALVIIGSLSLFSFKEGIYSYIKDVVYFIRPITVLLASYILVKNCINKATFYNLIVLVGFSFATIHILQIEIGIWGISTDVNNLRNYFGRTNHVELVALFLVITSKNLSIKKTKFKIIYQTFVAILIVSFIMYFSRTMLLVLLLMIFAYYGYLKLNVKGIIYLIVLLFLSGSFIFFINRYEPDEESGIVATFLLKIKNSYTEAFESIEMDEILMDKRSLWPHWRAYEAYLVYNEVAKEKSWVLGKGFGSAVDAGFELRLQGEWIQKLPIVHNGIAYVYMKTGILGLIIYGFSILFLYLYYYRQEKSDELRIYNKMLAAYAFYMIISSMVITGIFKPYDMVTLLIGGTFALKQKTYFENRNSRNEGDT